MPKRSLWLLFAALAAAPACAGAEGGPAPAASSAAPSAPALPAPPTPGSSAPASAPAGASAAASPPAPGASGEIGRTLHDTPAQALAAAITPQPRVLAIGETHAQKGAVGVASATKRFTDDLLPALAPRASDLLIELWVADPRCNKEKVAAVQKEQQAVTEKQAESNQNEFVTMAERAKALGVQPHVLRPSCEEYDSILKAGDDAVDEMLTMIGRLTAAKVKDLIAKRGDGGGKMIITYGGALHNDVAPRPGREKWSFGPELAAQTGGKYVELDIIVREFIRDTESWRARPWYGHFNRDQDRGKVVLFRP
ncbi:MAG: hypothetical protein IT372_05815, partial [Polyangiaceae bacterium]|nr:hypothetical protein [Polyangiaceae bacterium]